MRLQRILSFSLVIPFSFIIVYSASLYAKDEPIKNRSALPGESCPTKPLKGWTPQEKWVWKQVCEGEAADFNKAKGYGGKLDPKTSKGWPKSRILRPLFLETILLHEPYRSALTHHGVGIVGAWFIKPLDLPDLTLAYNLWLNDSRFESSVDLAFLQTPYSISLEGSSFAGTDVILYGAKIGGFLNMNRCKFTGTLRMTNLEVKGDLIMDEGAEFNEVDLWRGKIGGELIMRSSKFTGTLNMIGLRIEGDVIMDQKAEFARVSLLGAKIGGFLGMDRSKFTDTLDMNSLQVEGNLPMKHAEFTEVVLLGARIKGQISMDASKFTSKLNMNHLQVEEILMRDIRVETLLPVSLIFAEIRTNLDISGSELPSFDLTGTQVRGEFRLGSKDHSSTMWLIGGKLILRNTEVGALNDVPEAWPANLELDGFTYARLGGTTADNTNDIANRDVTWLKNWLAKQKTYSPQSYEQLASVLEKQGHKEKAKEILYAGRERERSQATGLNWIWLTLLNYAIGYGYRFKYALYWSIFWIIVGMLVLWRSEQGVAERSPPSLQNRFFYVFDIFFYSLDMLLPIINLDKRHRDAPLTDAVRYYFYIHQLIGYVLAFFLVAGLSGLTK